MKKTVLHIVLALIAGSLTAYAVYFYTHPTPNCGSDGGFGCSCTCLGIQVKHTVASSSDASARFNFGTYTTTCYGYVLERMCLE